MEGFCKKGQKQWPVGVLKNHANAQENNFAGAFFNKVAGCRPATLLKGDAPHHRRFLMNFAKFLGIFI